MRADTSGEMTLQRVAKYGYVPFVVFVCPLVGLISWAALVYLTDSRGGAARAVFCLIGIPVLLAYGAGRATQRSVRDLVVASILAVVMVVVVYVGLIVLIGATGGFD